MTLKLGNTTIAGATIQLGQHLNIGQIVQSALPLTDAGLHLLDGALIQGDGIYSAFVDYIASIVSTYPSVFTTESAWQSSVTTYGVCGKFVYDSTNNTVRLPKYNSKIYTGGGTAPVIGNGLPMHFRTENGSSQSVITSYRDLGGSGLTAAWYDTSTSSIIGTKAVRLGLSTNPENSGLIAQLSNITTSLDGYYYIVIATSTKTDIEVDIDEIATDLNGKADVDLTNCTKPHIVETYVNGASWYRIYSDGWCEQGGGPTTTGTVTFLKPFINTNITLTMTRNSAYQGAISAGFHGSWTSAPTTTGFTCFYDSNTAYSWCARGYIR